ncbi:hypothetical protein TNCV_1160021 [Trichonephila clavipes]|nr:hypothetical protein TNCV_1160021 [Trichonephila clavipes]
MALYRSTLTVTLWPSSFLKKYGPMIPPAHKAHQTGRAIKIMIENWVASIESLRSTELRSRSKSSSATSLSSNSSEISLDWSPVFDSVPHKALYGDRLMVQ